MQLVIVNSETGLCIICKFYGLLSSLIWYKMWMCHWLANGRKEVSELFLNYEYVHAKNLELFNNRRKLKEN